LDVLWDWVKEKLTTEELRNYLFLHKDDKKEHLKLAGIMGNTVPLAKIWKWGKVNITPEELKNKCFVLKDDTNLLLWQVAAV